MSRDWRLRIEDLLLACSRAQEFLGQLDVEGLRADPRTAAALQHQLLIVGEAATRLPEEGGDPGAGRGLVALECPGGLDRPEVARLARFAVSESFFSLRAR